MPPPTRRGRLLELSRQTKPALTRESSPRYRDFCKFLCHCFSKKKKKKKSIKQRGRRFFRTAAFQKALRWTLCRLFLHLFRLPVIPSVCLIAAARCTPLPSTSGGICGVLPAYALFHSLWIQRFRLRRKTRRLSAREPWCRWPGCQAPIFWSEALCRANCWCGN